MLPNLGQINHISQLKSIANLVAATKKEDPEKVKLKTKKLRSYFSENYTGK